MANVVHFSFFDTAPFVCGGEWPEPVKRKPLDLGPDYPRMTFRREEVTCAECVAYLEQHDRALSAAQGNGSQGD